jgi:hypothetical protein
MNWWVIVLAYNVCDTVSMFHTPLATAVLRRERSVEHLCVTVGRSDHRGAVAGACAGGGTVSGAAPPERSARGTG